MIGCCPPPRMRWNAVIGATVRCKATSIAYARKRRSGHAWRWICGVKPKPKAVNKPSPHSIVHGLDKPGIFTTVSFSMRDLPTDNKSRFGFALRNLLALLNQIDHRIRCPPDQGRTVAPE